MQAAPAWRGESFFVLQQLVLKDFRIRYRNMSLGLLWSLINPLVMMGMLVFIFSYVQKPSVSQPAFPVFILCGLVPFNFFTGAWISGTVSVVDSQALIKKVPVPRELVPIAAVLSNGVHLLIQLALLFVFLFAYGRGPNIHWFWLPVIWILDIVFVCGLALFTSAVNVFIRDTRYVVESANLILFWLVPIFYSFASIPAQYHNLYRFNPAAAMTLAMRNILLEEKSPPDSLLTILCFVSIASFILGWLVFRRLKPGFYDHI
ncbi:MAG: ABC transporter permease [Bryobacteraceae bacterium]